MNNAGVFIAFNFGYFFTYSTLITLKWNRLWTFSWQAVLKHAATTGSRNHDQLYDQGVNVAVQEATDPAEDVHQTRQVYHKIICLLQTLKTSYSL